MRIGMLLDNSFPPDSRVENEAVSLLKSGHEVHLFSLCYKQKLPLQEVHNGIQVHRYPAGKLLYKFSALAYTLPVYHYFVQARIKDFIKKNKIEALHIHDMMLAQAAFDANKEFNLPTVLDLHENRPEIMRHYRWVNNLSGKLLVRRANWAAKQTEFIKQADRVILVTEEAKHQAILETGVHAKKISVVPNTITPEIYYNYPVEQKIIERFRGGFNLLYLGDTGLRRGTDMAIEALALLKTEIPELQLIMVGRSKEDFILRNLTQKLNVQDSVFFEGWQDVSLFPSYTLAADVCLSPLVRNLHHDTTFANKIFQYMAMERPILVSDCPPQAHVAETENCGLVHKGGDVQDLADKIKDLYQNPFQRHQMGINGKIAVGEKYNWPVTSRELIQLYSSISE